MYKTHGVCAKYLVSYTKHVLKYVTRTAALHAMYIMGLL